MDLLNNTPCDFRYALYHTSDKQIIILFLKSQEEINDYSVTQIETLYENTILKSYKINSNEIYKVTCNENFKTNDIMNQDIISYCKKYTDTKEIRFINTTPMHKILFEAKTFTTIVNTTKELYLELGDSGIIIGSGDLNTLDKLTIQSGSLYPDSTANIYVKELFVMRSDITVANKTKDTHAMNFIISRKANVIAMSIYSTVTTVFTAGSKEGENISNCSFISNYINIYGSEEVSEKRERLGIFSFKSVTIGELDINEEVIVGNILKIDKLVSFSLNKLNRNINTLYDGYCICINRVGTVNLTNINYDIKKSSVIPNDVSIIHFLKDTDSGLNKGIFLYDTTINNPTGSTINLLSLEESTIQNVYVSGCTITNNVNIIKKVDEAELLKLTFNNVQLSSDLDISFNNIQKLYLTNCTMNTTKDIVINSKYVSINDGLWYFDKCSIGSSRDIIFNVSIQNIELHGNRLEVLLDKDNSIDGKFFDNNSKFDVKEVIIDGFQTSFAGSIIFSSVLSCSCDKVLTITKSSLIMTNDVDLNINCSISGVLMLDSSSDDNKLNMNIKDVQKFLSINTLDLITMSGESPLVNITTNNPIKFKFINHMNELVYINYYNDFESDQNSKLVFVPSVLDTRPIEEKIITNTEKLLTINKLPQNSDNSDREYEVIQK